MSLVGHWKLQDNAPSTTVVADVGANGALMNAGNTSGIVAPGPGTLLTSSLNFNSGDGNDFVSITQAFTGSATCMVAMWIYAPAIPSAANITQPWSMSNEGIGLSWNHTIAGYRGAAYRGPDGFPAAKFGSLPANAWVHLAAAWNGTNLRTFQNGVLITTTPTTTAASNATAFYIGNVAAANRGFVGRIADVRLYDSDESANLPAIMSEAGYSQANHYYRHFLGSGAGL